MKNLYARVKEGFFFKINNDDFKISNMYSPVENNCFLIDLVIRMNTLVSL